MSTPFKDHPQFQQIIDILSRKEQHQVLLLTEFSARLRKLFLQGLAQYWQKDIRSCDLQDYQPANEPMVILANKAEYQQRQHQSNEWIVVELSGVTDPYAHEVLKLFRTELEDYHRVVIPDEILVQAYELSRRYLSYTTALDQALLLLDSAAARAIQSESHDADSKIKPLLSSQTLLNVLSCWTGIAMTQLQTHKFKTSEFLAGMQQQLYGQEMVASVISHALQQAHMPLGKKSGTFASFLFVGPPHVGKQTAAHIAAEVLFKQTQLFFYANFSPGNNQDCMTKIKVKSEKDQRYHVLSTVMQQFPYAVIYLDNIHHASAAMLQSLEEVLSTGCITNSEGEQCDFHQATIILATTVGAEALTATASSTNVKPTDDLIQLMMADQSMYAASRIRTPLSPEMLCTQLMPTLMRHFSAVMLEHLTITPFISLEAASMDKIIRMRLKVLSQHLEQHYGLELTYAPEVIRYLIHEATVDGKQAQSLEKVIEQRVYAMIGQMMLANVEDKHRPQQLYIQLNDTGELLRVSSRAAVQEVG